ncbi:NAD-dependent epimerase/dehydratase family protein [Mucilaginibacter pedocola]|uniref:UDP-glucose 4-epimerase n=1 Tax=Mucilaginibacter pedocola TaxID=1792845 RepID=A0A1S9PG40_9SPHI|nr:NAD(P)-dependent oxidoreductase [Mucilaginibacter pedocola]OOQ59922.1 UDP-glucose 4-epimerase [Mucilaginibacter pedocola]
MRERVLITGASGFVGYHIIAEALKHNLEVYAAVRKASNTDHLRQFNIQYTHLRYNDVEGLIKEIKEKQYDYIIHLAGVNNGRSQKEYVTVNTYFAYNLAKAAEECGVKKFIQMSSLAAIGPLKSLNGLLTEGTAPAPVNTFGKSKLAAEKKIATLTKLNYTILRPAAVYGPRDKGFFLFIKQMAKGLEPYAGEAEQKRSVLFAPDLAVATINALHAPPQSSYNLSDGNFYNRYELGDLVKELLKLRVYKIHFPVNFVKIIAALNGKLSSLRGKATTVNTDKIAELTAKNWHCDIAKAQAEIGFYPRHNLPAGLSLTLAWYKENNWL